MSGPICYLKREDAEVMARTVEVRTANRGCVEVHGLTWTSPSLLEWENRPRWLCPNLEKMAHMTPPTIIGFGTSKVRLYSRTAPPLEKYKMT